MSESRKDDLSTDDKLNILSADLDSVEARLERIEELLEDISEKLDNINLSGDGYEVYE